MPPKRAVPREGDGGGEYAADEFTRVVRKKLSASTRTSVACDRCKVRKIRCDGLPGGCSPCSQNKTECKTTDRISQKAVPRGYLENLEVKVQELEDRNKELSAALLAAQASVARVSQPIGYTTYEQDWAVNGVPKPAPRMLAPNQFSASAPPANEYHPMNGTSAPGPKTKTTAPHGISFPIRKASSHYLGISAGNSYLSSMKEAALSILGIDIDLSDLNPSEPAGRNDSQRLDDSYGSCLATVFNCGTGVQRPELPPKEEGLKHIMYYFMISHAYLPILHQPTFLKMVNRIYDDETFQATAAQTAQLHIVLAICHFQYGALARQKNPGHVPQAAVNSIKTSNRHYHYTMSLMYDLLNDTSLEDLQAIGLILQHLRSFPKPGGSWILSRIAISLCLEHGLHRSAKKWKYNLVPNFIEIEMRKRVFWCILALEVSLASKLGRPMSIKQGDFDAEFPERVDDEYILEGEIIKKGEDEDQDCRIDIAIDMFKHALLTIEIHTKLYGVSRPERNVYVSVVESIEAKLDKWRAGCCKTITLDSPKLERQFQAAHLHCWYHEAKILMRHPSIDLSPSPIFTRDCTEISVNSSRELLRLTDNLRRGNHYLDTTWYGATVQLLATLTILFSVWDKRNTVTAEEIAEVQRDMDLCMDIMGDLGRLLGSPTRLRDVVQALTVRTMEFLTTPSKPTPPPPPQPFTTPYPPLTAVPMKLSSLGDYPAPSYTYPPPPPPDPFEPPPPQDAGVFPWGWNGNESWRQYMQNIGSIVESLDPSETYASSALIALGQDCNGGGGGGGAPAAPAEGWEWAPQGGAGST